MRQERSKAMMVNDGKEERGSVWTSCHGLCQTARGQRHYSPTCRHIGVPSLFALGVHRSLPTQMSVSALLIRAELWCSGEAVPRLRMSRLARCSRSASSVQGGANSQSRSMPRSFLFPHVTAELIRQLDGCLRGSNISKRGATSRQDLNNLMVAAVRVTHAIPTVHSTGSPLHLETAFRMTLLIKRKHW